MRSLALMPICAYKYKFSNETFSCSRCDIGLKSYGLQEDSCITCMRAWLQGTSSDFKMAQYDEFCSVNRIFSIVLFAVVPSLACLVAILLCCLTKANGIRGKHNLCEDARPESAEKNRGVRRQGTRYVRKVTRTIKDTDEPLPLTPAGDV